MRTRSEGVPRLFSDPFRAQNLTLKRKEQKSAELKVNPGNTPKTRKRGIEISGLQGGGSALVCAEDSAPRSGKKRGTPGQSDVTGA